MIVCIAEKPSVARDIAEVLGARNRKEGYIEGNGYQVTWTFGHLCTLKEPHEYTPSWKAWSLSSLPMIPPRFGIKLINDPGIEKQFHIIEGLMQQADEIINCGDAGQEGELSGQAPVDFITYRRGDSRRVCQPERPVRISAVVRSRPEPCHRRLGTGNECNSSVYIKIRTKPSSTFHRKGTDSDTCPDSQTTARDREL